MSSVIDRQISEIEQAIGIYEEMENEIPDDRDRVDELQLMQQSGFFSSKEITLLQSLQNRRDLLYRQLQDIAAVAVSLRRTLQDKAAKTQQFVEKHRIHASIVNDLSALLKDAYERLERMEWWIEDRKQDFANNKTAPIAASQQQQQQHQQPKSILKIQPQQQQDTTLVDVPAAADETEIQITETTSANPTLLSYDMFPRKRFKLSVTPSFVDVK